MSGYGAPQFVTSGEFGEAFNGDVPPHHLPARSPHRLSNPAVPGSVRFENTNASAQPALGLSSPIVKSVTSPTDAARQQRDADGANHAMPGGGGDSPLAMLAGLTVAAIAIYAIRRACCTAARSPRASRDDEEKSWV